MIIYVRQEIVFVEMDGVRWEYVHLKDHLYLINTRDSVYIQILSAMTCFFTMLTPVLAPILGPCLLLLPVRLEMQPSTIIQVKKNFDAHQNFFFFIKKRLSKIIFI